MIDNFYLNTLTSITKRHWLVHVDWQLVGSSWLIVGHFQRLDQRVF